MVYSPPQLSASLGIIGTTNFDKDMILMYEWRDRVHIYHLRLVRPCDINGGISFLVE